jgi:hypothetical protein
VGRTLVPRVPVGQRTGPYRVSSPRVPWSTEYRTSYKYNCIPPLSSLFLLSFSSTYTVPLRYRAGALRICAGYAYLAIMEHALTGHCPSPFLQETLFPDAGGFIDGRYCQQVTLGNSTLSCCLPCPLAEWRYDSGKFCAFRVCFQILTRLQ